MNRRHDSRRKASQDLWTCQNPDCKRIVNINDDILLDEITAILNRLIADPVLIQTDSITDPPLEVRRLQGEVNRQLDGYEPDKESLKDAVFKLAAEKYRNIGPSNIISLMLRAAFEQSEPLSSFSPALFKQTVRQIQFDESGDPALVLKNNQRIGKEIDHADSNHEHTGDSDITA